MSRQLAAYMAMMDDTQRANFQANLDKQGRQQGALRLGAGALDFFGGQRAQNQADAQIAELGEQAEGIRTQLGEMRAPGSMDPSTVAEATRNAAILGFQSEPDDPSDDLARQAMALESGADPSKLYAASTQADQAADAQQRAESQQQFQQGLEMAQTDALNRFKQDYQTMAGDLESLEGEIGALQQESLLAQQRKQRGLQGAVTGGGQFLSSGGLDEIKSAFGGKPQEEDKEDPFDPQAGSIDFSDGQPIIASQQRFDPVTGQPVNPELQLNEGQTASDFLTSLDEASRPPAVGSNAKNNDGTPDNDGDPTNSLAYGGSVQQTPGEYDHDTNDMILMAQGKDGMLIDTGIRQTGGEFVIDPFDAGNMRQAHEKIDPVNLEKVRQGRSPMTEELAEQLFRMYDAVRFINEPQFDDDYYEKKISGQFDDRYYEKKMMGHA